MTTPAPALVVTPPDSDLSLSEFFDAIEWGEEPVLESPTCSLENPEICESCT